MQASSLLKQARAGAGLSQRALARRTGVPQAAISRIKHGVVSPMVSTLERLLKACDMELVAVHHRGDVDRTLIREWLELTPGQRVRGAAREWEATRPFRRHRATARP